MGVVGGNDWVFGNASCAGRLGIPDGADCRGGARDVLINFPRFKTLSNPAGHAWTIITVSTMSVRTKTRLSPPPVGQIAIF